MLLILYIFCWIVYIITNLRNLASRKKNHISDNIMASSCSSSSSSSTSSDPIPSPPCSYKQNGCDSKLVCDAKCTEQGCAVWTPIYCSATLSNRELVILLALNWSRWTGMNLCCYHLKNKKAAAPPPVCCQCGGDDPPQVNVGAKFMFMVNPWMLETPATETCRRTYM